MVVMQRCRERCSPRRMDGHGSDGNRLLKYLVRWMGSKHSIPRRSMLRWSMLRWSMLGQMVLGEMVLGEMVLGEMVLGEMVLGEMVLGQMKLLVLPWSTAKGLAVAREGQHPVFVPCTGRALPRLPSHQPPIPVFSSLRRGLMKIKSTGTLRGGEQQLFRCNRQEHALGFGSSSPERRDGSAAAEVGDGGRQQR